MPLPPAILDHYLGATLEPVPTGDEAWVLVVHEPPGGPVLARPGPQEPAQIWERLNQAGLDWTPTQIRCGDWSSEAACIRGVSRDKALRLGQKLRRWAMLRSTPAGVEVLYTGINDRAH